MNLSQLPLSVRQRFHGMTDEEKTKAIKNYEKEMSAKEHADIQSFVSDMMKKGHKQRHIKKMVKQKFKVIVI